LDTPSTLLSQDLCTCSSVPGIIFTQISTRFASLPFLVPCLKSSEKLRWCQHPFWPLSLPIPFPTVFFVTIFNQPEKNIYFLKIFPPPECKYQEYQNVYVFLLLCP
jgi:hypothetical protein